MSERMKKLTPVQVWLLSGVISAAVIECLALGAGILLTGKISPDYLLAGLVVSLIVAGFAGSMWNSIQSRQKEIEPDLQISAPSLETPEDIAATDGAAMNTAIKEVAGKITRDAAAHAPPERKMTAEPIRANQVHKDLKLSIKNLDTLPAMPVIAQRLLALKLDTQEGERMMLTLIEQDPQISAKILGLANSAMVGASRQIKTVKDAAMLLGTKRVQSVATGIAIISLMNKAPAGEFHMQDLWLHSFGIAFAMQGIARFMPASMRPHDEQIFLAGMLHDIGYLALAFLDPKLSDRLHNHLSAQPDRPSLEIEREILDVCHDELGAELGRHWNLPEEIIAVLHYHHDPDAAEAAVGQPLVRMANIAGRLLPTCGIIEYATPDIGAGEWEALGIDPTNAGEVAEQVDKAAEQAMQLAQSFN